MTDIKGFIVDEERNPIVPDLAERAKVAEVAESVKGVWVNSSNNLEINSNPYLDMSQKGTLSTDSKVNLVSMGAVQIKPGKDAKKDDAAETLQLDVEQAGINCNEFGIKVCNGARDKAARVNSLKVNTTELTFDTQNANSAEFDPEEFSIKFRYDKKDHPIYAKMKARAFDFRCLDHGGIALQIAGHDGQNHENKIKFESDRTTGIGEEAAYCGEGGKGVEFGTFNTEKASLYVGEYRFRGESKVYGVTRSNLYMNENGKIDYEKQSDDFADIVDLTNGATWNDIIKVANAYKASGYEFVTNQVLDESGNTIDLADFVQKNELNEILEGMEIELPESIAALRRTGSNNLEISSSIFDTPAQSIEGENGVEVVPAFNAKLNLKASGDASLESKNGNVLISGANFKIKETEAAIKLDKIALDSTTNNAAVVEAANGINLSITNKIISVGTKISTKGKLETSDLEIQLAYLNNNPNDVYVTPNGFVHIPFEFKTYYKAANVVYDPSVDTAKTNVYIDAECTTPLDGTGSTYLRGGDGNVWVVEYEAGAFKKVNSDISKASNHGILNTIAGFEHTIIEPIDYVAPEGSKKIAKESVESYKTVKLSDLLGLMDRVEKLEAMVEALIAKNEEPEVEA